MTRRSGLSNPAKHVGIHKPEAQAKPIVPPSAAPSRPVNFGEIWF